MTDDAVPAVRNNLLDHSDEVAEPYQIRHTDMNLVDAAVERYSELMNQRGVKARDRRDGAEAMSAFLGIGEMGEKFHEQSEGKQSEMLMAAIHSPTLEMANDAVFVGLELKPALPTFTGPTGPQFAPMGPGMGGGMRPNAPQPTPPGGMPPQFYPQQPPSYDPYSGQHNPYGAAYPPQQPPAGYPTYPPQAYPPGYGAPPPGDPSQAGHYQGYAQPHPYPSYPVPPHQNYPQPGAPPHWPPSSPPNVIEAEEVKNAPDDQTKSEE